MPRRHRSPGTVLPAPDYARDDAIAPQGPGSGAQNPRKRRRWLMLAIVAALAIDYATIMRIEIFAEMRAGRSFVEALAYGNALLTGIGVLISIVGVAAILYLAFGRRT